VSCGERIGRSRAEIERGRQRRRGGDE